ncbi:MAG: hypothetical protein NTU88_06115 [Armatimonadetes bacterium]|nr:hypothetical protein [Armatimonadota bacterium]
MKNFLPLSGFDKVCAALSIGVGVVFMGLGVIGLFIGASAHFTLPPILGALPFFLGWGMCVPLVKYWKMSGTMDSPRAGCAHDMVEPGSDKPDGGDTE